MGFKPVRGEYEGPTWRDVLDLQLHLNKEHKCLTEVTFLGADRQPPWLEVTLTARRAAPDRSWYTCRYVVGRWPTHRAKTMPALLVELLWKLSDAMIDYDELPILRDLMPKAELPPPPA